MCKISEFVNRYQGFIAIIGIIVAMGIYLYQEHKIEKNIDEAINITSCLNLKIASLMIKGKNNAWNYVARYQVQVYYDNLPSLLNNYKGIELKGSALALINNMQTINKELELNSTFEPLIIISYEHAVLDNFRKENNNNLSSSSGEIIQKIKGLGFTEELCRKYAVAI